MKKLHLISILGLSGCFAACSGTTITQNNIVSSGGSTSNGGTSNIGGSSVAGGSTSTSSIHATGGVTSTGGAISTGGAPALSGSSSTGGTPSTGGVAATAGATSAGATGTTGGVGASGGTSPTGGSSTAGGVPNTGGNRPTGGTSAPGGATSTSAGASAVGGVASTAGTSGTTGGSSTQTICNGSVDLQTSDANCGACNYACVHGRHCSAGLCSPAWQSLATANAPTPRASHGAAYLGGQFVIFGGSLTYQGAAISSSAAYDVANDTWSTLAPLNNARCGHSAVSTGNTIITFGGLTDCQYGQTTGPGLEQFTPDTSTGSWSVITVSGEPTPRYNFATVWTGSSMFLYGGSGNGFSATTSGAFFDPSGPSWTDASCSLTNSERGGGFTAFIDGTLIKIWGGATGSLYGNAPAGIAYDLNAKTWTPWTIPAISPTKLAYRFADDGRRIYYLLAINDVSIYDRKTSSWLADDTSVMPTGFCTQAPAVWTGSELVAWSDYCGAAPVNVGGRYQPPAPLN